MHDAPTNDERGTRYRERALPDWLVLPAMLALVLSGLVAGRFLRPPPEVLEGESTQGQAVDWKPASRPEGRTFSLTIDFGNGAERRFAALRWRDGLTVLEALQAAADFRPGITFTLKGKGETAFLSSLEGLKNSGAGGGNWIYEINGEMAQRGMAVQTLNPGDALLWRYAPPP